MHSVCLKSEMRPFHFHYLNSIHLFAYLPRNSQWDRKFHFLVCFFCKTGYNGVFYFKRKFINLKVIIIIKWLFPIKYTVTPAVLSAYTKPGVAQSFSAMSSHWAETLPRNFMGWAPKDDIYRTAMLKVRGQLSLALFLLSREILPCNYLTVPDVCLSVGLSKAHAWWQAVMTCATDAKLGQQASWGGYLYLCTTSLQLGAQDSYYHGDKGMGYRQERGLTNAHKSEWPHSPGKR